MAIFSYPEIDWANLPNTLYEECKRRCVECYQRCHYWEKDESYPLSNKFYRACLAEFLAMHLFVLLCCGCAMVTLNLSNPNLMMVAASFGFGILCLAQIFGPLSGGHINCAVSFGLFVSGRCSFIRAFCFTLSQMLGSVFGALFLWAIFGNNWPAARAFGSNSWDESIFTGGQVFLAEILGTMLLVYNVFATIDIPGGGGGALGVYPIAMSVMVAHLFLLPIDGCSINPTRSFGPSLVAAWAGIGGTYYHQQYMFWFGPLFGAFFAAVIYEYAPLKLKKREGAMDMAESLFLANEKRPEDSDEVEQDDNQNEVIPPEPVIITTSSVNFPSKNEAQPEKWDNKPISNSDDDEFNEI